MPLISRCSCTTRRSNTKYIQCTSYTNCLTSRLSCNSRSRIDSNCGRSRGNWTTCCSRVNSYNTIITYRSSWTNIRNIGWSISIGGDYSCCVIPLIRIICIRTPTCSDAKWNNRASTLAVAITLRSAHSWICNEIDLSNRTINTTTETSLIYNTIIIESYYSVKYWRNVTISCSYRN